MMVRWTNKKAARPWALAAFISWPPPRVQAMALPPA
jgi:hypothetical protein